MHAEIENFGKLDWGHHGASTNSFTYVLYTNSYFSSALDYVFSSVQAELIYSLACPQLSQIFPIFQRLVTVRGSSSQGSASCCSWWTLKNACPNEGCREGAASDLCGWLDNSPGTGRAKGIPIPVLCSQHHTKYKSEKKGKQGSSLPCDHP